MIPLTQKFLALDLELNQPSSKIIQVGISIGSIQDDPKQYITKKWYIDPKEPIDPFITQLTGITSADISRESWSHATVARELSELIKEHDVFLNPITWGGNDSYELQAEFSKNMVDFPHFGRRWIDVKTWYTMLMLAKGKNPSGHLAGAMGVFKLPFDGKAHRADVDAFNTLKFFFTILRRQRGLENLLSDAKKI